MTSALIHYFSGTGNTSRAAHVILAQADDKVRQISGRIAAQQKCLNHCSLLNCQGRPPV